MALVTIKVDGLKELDAALGELSKRTARGVVKRILTKAAEPIAIDAANKAPFLWGDLALSMSFSFTKPKGADAGKAAFADALRRGASRAEAREALLAARPSGGGSFAEVFVGPGRNPQAIFQEFGTSRHQPQPYMRPVWDARKGWALETIKSELAQEIGKAAKRAAAKQARQAAKGG